LVASTGDFYTAMLGACDNPVITEILEQLTARISFLRARSMSRQGRANLSLVELSAILDAVEARDADAARRACSAHVEQAKVAAKASFEETMKS
jgi:DNA-binding GntR family transcriptional regulator